MILQVPTTQLKSIYDKKKSQLLPRLRNNDFTWNKASFLVVLFSAVHFVLRHEGNSYNVHLVLPTNISFPAAPVEDTSLSLMEFVRPRVQRCDSQAAPSPWWIVLSQLLKARGLKRRSSLKDNGSLVTTNHITWSDVSQCLCKLISIITFYLSLKIRVRTNKALDAKAFVNQQMHMAQSVVVERAHYFPLSSLQEQNPATWMSLTCWLQSQICWDYLLLQSPAVFPSFYFGLHVWFTKCSYFSF